MTDEQRNDRAGQSEPEDLELQDDQAEQVAGGRKAGEGQYDFFPPPPPPPPTTK